ncbi:MAG: hypothetical protein K8S22_12940 [Betaproteobacteria bacterium]|nr:hypothetical protein [Betaproteobacteria bacterium]
MQANGSWRFFFVALNGLNRQAAKTARKFECETVWVFGGMIFKVLHMTFYLSILSLAVLGGLGGLAVNL